jgi:hypothetical protein
MNYTLMHFFEYLLYSNVHFSVTGARRTPEQNKACNGAPNSQHLVGEAVDIKPYGSTTFNKLFEMIHFFLIMFRHSINLLYIRHLFTFHFVRVTADK